MQAANQAHINKMIPFSNQKIIISEMRKSKVLNDLLFLDELYLKESKNIRVLSKEMSEAMADLAVEENLPAEKEKVARNHLLTLVQAGIPMAAAYRVIKNIVKGEFLEAFKNLPGINVLLTPEAVYELVMSGLGALPENIKKDLVENKYAKAMLRLLFSIKELQKSEDIGEFYDNLKLLVKESSHALIVFASFLAAVAAVCATSGASIVSGGVAVLAAIEAATVGLASPAVAAALAAALSILVAWETICGILAVGAAGGAVAGFVSFLITKVSKMNPEAEVFRDEKFRQELMKFVQGMSEEHTQKMKARKEEMEAPLNNVDSVTPSTEEDLLSDPITMPYSPEMSTPEQDLKLVAENKTYERWRVLAGIE